MAPPAPLIARLASTVEVAQEAARTAELAERGRALLRLVAPLAIEAAPRVVYARAAAPSWANLAVLAEARDVEAQDRFGCGAIELFHRLHGIGAPPDVLGAHRIAWLGDLRSPARPAALRPIAGWHDRDGEPLATAAISEIWERIAARLGVRGSVRVERAERPRTFVVEPGREVIVVVPHEVASPAARSEVLHELGHAAAALACAGPGVVLPRLVDEAAASAVARLAEGRSALRARLGELPGGLPPPWANPFAGAARIRRAALAALLDRLERRLPALPEPPPSAQPPPALWHDPGAQAVYAIAER